jgi:hypothetical protein
MRDRLIFRLGQALLAFGLVSSCALAPKPGGGSMPVGAFAGCFGFAELTIGKDGRTVSQAMFAPGGGDVITVVKADGRIRRDGDWFVVTLTSGPPEFARSAIPVTQRLHPVDVQGRMFLLDQITLIDLVNTANRFGPSTVTSVGCYLHRTTTRGGDQQINLPPDALLIPEYRKLVLSTPLLGKVASIGTVSSESINVAPLMQPARMVTRYSARIMIDRGGAAGVFAGMRLFVGPRNTEAIVDEVTRDTSQARIAWFDEAPSAGSAVSSAPRPATEKADQPGQRTP